MQKRDFLKALAIGGMGGLAAGGLGATGGRGGPNPAALSKYQQRFEEILDTNTFRAGYAVYPAFFMRDANTGAMSGIFYELSLRIAELAGLNIEWAWESQYGTVGNDLDSGKYDLYCGGIWPEMQRARLINFSDALFYSGLEVYHTPSLTGKVTDVKQLNDATYTMATIDGEMSSIVHRTDFAKAKTVSLPVNADISLLAENVATGRCDFTTIERTIAMEYLQHNPGKLERLAGSKPIRVFSNTFAVARDNLPMMNMLEVGLRELLFSGAVEEILKKYEAVPGSLYRVVSTYDLTGTN